MIKILFPTLCEKKLRNDQETMFWKEVWCGVVPFRDCVVSARWELQYRGATLYRLFIVVGCFACY